MTVLFIVAAELRIALFILRRQNQSPLCLKNQAEWALPGI